MDKNGGTTRDRRFTLPAGTFDFDDILSPAAGKIRAVQLLDRELWKKLTALFGNPGVDDADHGWRCEYWGKMMRGACFLYRCSPVPDDELYAVLEETVRDMLTKQDALGRFSTYSADCEFRGWDIWGRKYILLGMLYFLEICRDGALADAITAALIRHADYILSKIGRAEEGKLVLPTCTDHWDGLNSCSILEPFVLLYNLTGEKRYLDFSEYIVSFGGTLHENLFDTAYRDEKEVCRYYANKAYEMISCFDGLAEYAKVTGNEYYREAVIRFGRRVLREEATVIGCLGCRFEQFDHASLTQTDETVVSAMQETCVTVTWMKFLWQLWRMTGDRAFMDALEVSAYNAMAAAMKKDPFDPENGGVPLPIHSYNPLRHAIRYKEIGGRKNISDRSVYGCCVCISSAGFALDTLAAAGTGEDGTLYINLYRDGSVRSGGTTVTVKTDYPASGTVNVTVTGGESGKIALRVPGWASSFTVTGVPYEEKDGYAFVSFSGSAAFTVEIGLGVRFVTPAEATDLPTAVDCFRAVVWGPLVFALEETGDAEPVLPLDETAPVFLEKGKESVYALSVGLKDGKRVTLVDYPSAGQDEGKKVCAWIRTSR